MMDISIRKGDFIKKKFWIIGVVVLVLLLGFAVKLFLIGEPVDASTLACSAEEVDNQLTIRAFSAESAVAFTDAQYEQQGTALYITFNKVLPSPLHRNGEKCIYLEKCDLAEVYLCGKLIWSAQYTG